MPRPDPPRPPRRPRSWRRAAWRVVRWLLVAYLMVLGILLFLENKLVFVPSKYPNGDWRPADLDFEDAWFESADGTRLHGWYVPCKQPLAYVLFCHGNAGNVSHRHRVLRPLSGTCRASVLVFDYRGFGRSEGRPDEQGVLADARAARAWLASRAGVAEDRIVVMGESLGGAVAVDLAARDGARALVLENTFSTLPEVAAWHFPWFPVRWLMRTRLDSVNKIGAFRGPLFQSHAEADTVVPYYLGVRLHEAANEPKEFHSLPGADHNDPHLPEYYRALRTFFQGLP